MERLMVWRMKAESPEDREVHGPEDKEVDSPEDKLVN